MTSAPRWTPADLAAYKARLANTVVSPPPEPCQPAPESQLQADAEAWLQHLGYWPRTPKALAAGAAPKGWYLHLHEARGNPLALDVLILANDGRWLELELKKRGGRVRECQRQILAACPATARLCYALNEVIEAVTQWEDDLDSAKC